MGLVVKRYKKAFEIANYENKMLASTRLLRVGGLGRHKIRTLEELNIGIGCGWVSMRREGK